MLAHIDWQAVAATTVILAFIWGLLVWLLAPHFKEWIWTVLEGDKARLREALKDELARWRLLEETVSEHSDSLSFIRTSIERQGEELRMLPRVAATMEGMDKSFRVMAGTLAKIHEEVIDHGKKFERWDGFMEGQRGEWLGEERRRKARRKIDHPEEQ